MSKIFANFPKERPALPPEFEAIYANHYKTNRDGSSKATGLAQKMESWMHRKVAEDIKSGASKSTLEIGAGTLNHLPYEPNSVSYDIVEPFKILYESSPHLHRIRSIYNEISEIPPTQKYERIVSIATFEHICNLPQVVAQAGLRLAENGKLRVAVPSEGTILWYLGYTYTTGLEFKRKYNLDYEVLMRHEHVNTAQEIEEVLSHFFANIKCKVFGISKAFSFYRFYDCNVTKFDNCRQYEVC